jgi:hypothetical protein
VSKLSQLIKDVDEVTKSYEDKLAELRKALTNGSMHRGMIEEGEGELLNRMKELEKKGKKGATVGDFYDDKEAKAYIDEIENQKAGLVKACGQYWQIRSSMDKIMVSAKGLVTTAGQLAADKKRQWFGSKSLQAIEATKTDLEAWCNDMQATLQNLDKLPKSGTPKLAWAAPGSTKKGKRNDVMDKQDLHDMKALLTFIQQRAADDPKRAATHKRIHDRLAEVAKLNPDV